METTHDKPVVLSYASPAGPPPARRLAPGCFGATVLGALIFIFGACAAGPEVALLIAVLIATVYVALRMAEDGHRPVWSIMVVTVLAGVAMVAIGVQASIIASDPGHPQSRWRPALFKPSIVAVPALVATVAVHRRAAKRRP